MHAPTSDELPVEHVHTTKGLLPISVLARTVGVEDRPDKIVLWVQWWLTEELVRQESYSLPKELADPVYTTHGMVPRATLSRRIELTDNPTDIAVVVKWYLGEELVRTDPNVVLKYPAVFASSAVGGF